MAFVIGWYLTMLRSSFRYEDNILPDAHPLDEQKHTTGTAMQHRKASAYSVVPGAVQLVFTSSALRLCVWH